MRDQRSSSDTPACDRIRIRSEASRFCDGEVMRVKLPHARFDGHLSWAHRMEMADWRSLLEHPDLFADRPLRIGELLAFLALSIINMLARGLETVELGLSLTDLRDRDSDLTVEERVLDPIGLDQSNSAREIQRAHVLDHSWTGCEPLICFNQKMGELTADGLATGATGGIDNILPLLSTTHKQFDEFHAGPVSTKDELVRFIRALEEDLARCVLLEGPEDGTWVPNPEDFEFQPGKLMEDATASPKVQHYVSARRGSAETKTSTTYEYDWWHYPQKTVRGILSEGFFHPGPGRESCEVRRPREGWSVPVTFADERPPFHAYARPIRCLTRFVWTKSVRKARGDPLVLSDEGTVSTRLIDYLVKLWCVLDLSGLSSALAKRPDDLLGPLGDEGDARLQYVKDHPTLKSGKRIFPVAIGPDGQQPPHQSTKRRRRDSEGEAEDDDDQRPAAQQRRTLHPESQGSASGSTRAGSTRAPSSSSTSTSTSTSTSSSSRLPSAAMSAKLQEFWQAHTRIMLFLEYHLQQGALHLEDLVEGWPRVAERLTEAQNAEAEALLAAKSKAAEDMVRLSEKESRNARDRNLKPV